MTYPRSQIAPPDEALMAKAAEMGQQHRQ